MCVYIPLDQPVCRQTGVDECIFHTQLKLSNIVDWSTVGEFFDKNIRNQEKFSLDGGNHL